MLAPLPCIFQVRQFHARHTLRGIPEEVEPIQIEIINLGSNFFFVRPV